jgi:hypothetical protein
MPATGSSFRHWNDFGHQRLLTSHRSYPEKDWVVYAKRPLAGPEEVLKYIARSTQRVAISSDRLLDINDGKVQFCWKASGTRR